jgi:hypothetical protein
MSTTVTAPQPRHFVLADLIPGTLLRDGVLVVGAAAIVGVHSQFPRGAAKSILARTHAVLTYDSRVARTFMKLNQSVPGAVCSRRRCAS